jgi:hypothetical protein
VIIHLLYPISKRDGNISLFVPGLNVSMRFDDLLERIRSIDDGSYLPCLDKFLEPVQVFNFIVTIRVGVNIQIDA